MSTSTRSLNSCSSPKADTSMATIAWPVLVALASSWLKSITSLPIAAPLSVPPGRQMVGIADREVHADHALCQHLSRVQRRGARVVAHSRADPRHPGGACLVDCELGGA